MSPTDPRVPLAIDPEQFLSSATARLTTEFAGVFGTETIQRFLGTSYEQLAATATVPNHLPLLTEKFARQRLHALATVESPGAHARPSVLFLCVHNAGRSQMALGFFTHYAASNAVGYSGGSKPGDRVNDAAIAAMNEVGIDISGEYPKPWTDEVVRAADVVITMGCGDACPVFPGKRYEEWALADPAGWNVDGIRPIRDDIERRVLNLLDELGIPAR